MRRIFADPGAFLDDKVFITERDDIFYVSGILRMKEGDVLLVSDGAGRAWEAKISEISKQKIELSVLKELPQSDGYRSRITLYQGIPKGAKMDEIVRKATELGVFRIVPVLTERSVPEWKNGVSQQKLLRWRRITEEASRQARRVSVPAVDDVVPMSEASEGIKGAGYDSVLVLYELEERNSLKSALRMLKEKKPENQNIAVFIGPEGGFETEEVEALVAVGAEPVTVGETILRTETAGPAAIAMIIYELELAIGSEREVLL